MTVDHYAKSGRRWATGASLVYGPIAAELVALSPAPLTGRRVLDAGAGTGVVSAVLQREGARPVAVDLSGDMLGWNRAARCPAAVADLRALPIATGAVDDAVAAFVLNHLSDPGPALAELVRAVRPGGWLLACVYSERSRSAARDAVDAEAGRYGWRAPAWYVDLKATATPVLATADAMAAAARSAGLGEISVSERPVDVGVTEVEQLVDYRFGQAHFAAWLDAMSPGQAARVRHAVAAAVRPVMEPYRPIVVFLAARAGV